MSSCSSGNEKRKRSLQAANLQLAYATLPVTHLVQALRASIHSIPERAPRHKRTHGFCFAFLSAQVAAT